MTRMVDSAPVFMYLGCVIKKPLVLNPDYYKLQRLRMIFQCLLEKFRDILWLF